MADNDGSLSLAATVAESDVRGRHLRAQDCHGQPCTFLPADRAPEFALVSDLLRSLLIGTTRTDWASLHRTDRRSHIAREDPNLQDAIGLVQAAPSK
jgi:hypothetical protein